MAQYLRSRDLEEIKKTLVILDNTNDKLVEIIPGVLAFLNPLGRIRLINLRTLEEVNREPLDIVGIVNNKILLRDKKPFLDGNHKSIVIDLDTYEIILDLNLELNIMGDFIYTSEIGILNQTKKEFRIYNSSGKIIFENYIHNLIKFTKIGKTDMYMLVYNEERFCSSVSEHEKTSYTSFLKYNVLDQSCKELSVLSGTYTLSIISDYTAIIGTFTGKENLSEVVDFSLVERGNANELSKIVNYKINL